MSESSGLILGFDPGGAGRFGWSVCGVENDELQVPLATCLADDAEDALDQVKKTIKSSGLSGRAHVLGAGIDAPLFWGRRGKRKVDDVLRKALRDGMFRTPSGTVQQINSLRGACLVQGVLLARYLSDWEPGLPITEAHPKALLHLLRHSGRTDMTMLARLVEGPQRSEHERDATLSAIGAWAMYKRLPGWRDLSCEEPNPLQPFGTPVAYWMPIPKGVDACLPAGALSS